MDIKLTPHQSRLKRLGSWRAKIGEKEAEFNERTAKYYESLHNAYTKGDTVQISKLHEERKNNNEMQLFERIQKQKAFLAKKVEQTITKITSSL